MEPHWDSCDTLLGGEIILSDETLATVRRRINVLFGGSPAPTTTSTDPADEGEEAGTPAERLVPARPGSTAVSGFVLRPDGRPAVNVPVRLEEGVPGSDALRVIRGTTDTQGFVSWTVSADAGDGVLRVVAFDGSTVDVTPSATTDGSAVARFSLGVMDGGSGSDGHAGQSAASYAPSLLELGASPRSFLRVPSLDFNDEGCRVPTPAAVAPTEFSFSQLVRRDQPPAGAATLPALPVKTPHPVDLTLPLPDADPPKLIYGYQLVYGQSWRLLGHAMGDIVYSLPLAPLQSENIAVVDWRRSETGARTEGETVQERLDHSLSRDRSLSETVDTALREYQGGFAVLGGVGGVLGTAPVLAAAGAGTSHTWGTRNLSGESVQDLADAVVQASEAVRSRRSTVVVHASQAERDVVETRTVSNYNQNHAMTVQYYEVLRHFRVETVYRHSQPIVFIPYTPVRFDAETAMRFRHILTRCALDRRVGAWIDALERSESAAAGRQRPAGGLASSPSGGLPPEGSPSSRLERLQIELETGDQQTRGTVGVLLGLRDGSWVLAGEVPSQTGSNALTPPPQVRQHAHFGCILAKHRSRQDMGARGSRRPCRRSREGKGQMEFRRCWRWVEVPRDQDSLRSERRAGSPCPAHDQRAGPQSLGPFRGRKRSVD